MDTGETTRILKANTVRSLGSKIVFNYEDIRRRCDEYVEQIRRQAQQLIADAQTDAKSLRQRAYEDGRKAGLEQGLQKAETQIQNRAAQLADQMAIEKLKTTLPAMREAADALVIEKDRWLAEWEESVIRLCVAIAEKITRRELNRDPQIAQEMIAETLQLAAGNPHIRLRMHPVDLERLGEHAQQVVDSLASCGESEFIPDETISLGGCVIETRHGVIDGRLETQLERITSELLQS